MIEDIIAQQHTLVDTLTYAEGAIARSAMRTIIEGHNIGGPFAQLLGIRFLELGDGRCSASLIVNHHMENNHGIAHGGVTFALADTACGGAALSAIGKPRIVTQDVQIRYHGPARPGAIVASANVIHFGQRTITTQCLVKQAETIIASATATFAILSSQEVDAINQAQDK